MYKMLNSQYSISSIHFLKDDIWFILTLNKWMQNNYCRLAEDVHVRHKRKYSSYLPNPQISSSFAGYLLKTPYRYTVYTDYGFQNYRDIISKNNSSLKLLIKIFAVNIFLFSISLILFTFRSFQVLNEDYNSSQTMSSSKTQLVKVFLTVLGLVDMLHYCSYASCLEFPVIPVTNSY